MLQVPTKEEFESLASVVKQLQKEVTELRSLPPYPEWVTVKQASEMLKRCSITVREMARRGDITYKKGKRKMEILSESIRQYNLKHTIK